MFKLIKNPSIKKFLPFLFILIIFSLIVSTDLIIDKLSGPKFIFPENSFINAPFEFNPIKGQGFHGKQCDIRDYGAIANSQFNNSAVINEAIEDCSQVKGTVIIPRGIWNTGAIKLKSNVHLFFEDGSELSFSQKPEDYLPVEFSRFEGMELYNYSPFIYCNECQNVVISGKGTLQGNGKKWQNWSDNQDKALEDLYKMSNENIAVENRIFGNQDSILRPALFEFARSDGIRIYDIYIKNSPMWAVHLLYSQNIEVNNIKISTIGHNTDGIVVDSSRNVLIQNSKIKSGDDAVSIKSGLDREGQRISHKSEDIVIQNIKVERGHSAVSLGSEMSGGINNILIAKSRFTNIDWGVRLKSLRGRGGIVENVWIDSCFISDADGGIVYDLDYPSSTLIPITKDLPRFRNIYVNNFSGELLKIGVFARGLTDSQIENISFNHFNIKSEEGLYIRNVQGMKITNSTLDTDEIIPIHLNNVTDIKFENNSCESIKDCLDNKKYEK
jgi:polygalacturonase